MINAHPRTDLLRQVEASTGTPLPAPSEQELHILKCAMRCFASHGFAATSVRAIAAEAGVTGPMINYYFEGKEPLYRRLVLLVSQAMQERLMLAAEPEGSLRERLRRVMHAYVDFATESPDAVVLFFAAAYGPTEGRPEIDIGAIRDGGQVALARVLDEGVERGDFVLRAGYEVKDLFELCLAALVHVIGREVTSGFPRDAARNARMKAELDRMAFVILEGISARTGASA